MVFTCGIKSSDNQNPECCFFGNEKESLSITVHEFRTIFPALFSCLHAQRPSFLLILRLLILKDGFLQKR